MNLFFRVFILLLKRLLNPVKADPFATIQTRFRVNPFDLDINLHMNNGRYLSIMDLGRVDLMMRAGVFWKFVRTGYYPVVMSESIRFRRSLEPFQSFVLITRLESWDEKNMFLKQEFVRGENVVAEAYVKARFRRIGRKGSVPTSEIFEVIGIPPRPPTLSELARCQNAIEAQVSGEEDPAQGAPDAN